MDLIGHSNSLAQEPCQEGKAQWAGSIRLESGEIGPRRVLAVYSAVTLLADPSVGG